MDWSQSQVKFFRALLHCYPAEFRHEYGGEMAQLFSERLQAERGLRLWLEAIADLALSAPKEHWHILTADLQYGARVLAAAPGFAAPALLVMALGIGATVAIFSLVNAVLFRPLPGVRTENLVYLWSPNKNFKGVPDELGPNVPDFCDWQRQSNSFSNMALFGTATRNLVRGGRAVGRVQIAAVTSNFFATLGVSPQFGRLFTAQEDKPGREQFAVISDEFWRAQFGGSPEVRGRELQIDRQRYTVIGVMPKNFGYPFDGDVPYEQMERKQTDVWLPLASTARQKTDRVNFDSKDAIARLRPGVSPAAAQAELAAIQVRLQPLYPAMWRGFSALVTPVAATIVGPVQKMFWLLLGTASLVLLIGISNVANLLLARAAARAHELGIRTALGAERSRIMRQLLTESLLLSVTGGLLGVAVAYAFVYLLVRLDPGGIPRFQTATVDARALWLAILLAVLAGFMSGVAPALSASRVDVNSLLKQGGQRIAAGFGQTRFVLIAGEIALSVILLAGAGLLIRSYLQLTRVNPGFSATTLTFHIELDDRYNKPELQNAFYKRALDKFKKIPGVAFAGASNSLPLTMSESVGFAEIEGFGKTKAVIENRSFTPDFRKALGIPLVRGRDFTAQEAAANRSVALVNQAFAAAYLRKRDPIGARVRLGMGDFALTPWSTIIGVVGDVHHLSLEAASQPQVIQPYYYGDRFALAFHGSESGVVRAARAALQSLDPVLTIDNIRTMGQRIGESNARRTFQTALMTAFASLAVVLALVGLYGLLSYSVRQRRAEIGIRIAIGSPRGAIIRLVVAQGLRVTAAGLLIGLAGAFGLTRLLAGSLFGVKALDPLTYGAVAAMILAVAGSACFIPAWSATKIDPVEALRAE